MQSGKSRSSRTKKNWMCVNIVVYRKGDGCFGGEGNEMMIPFGRGLLSLWDGLVDRDDTPVLRVQPLGFVSLTFPVLENTRVYLQTI